MRNFSLKDLIGVMFLSIFILREVQDNDFISINIYSGAKEFRLRMVLLVSDKIWELPV